MPNFYRRTAEILTFTAICSPVYAFQQAGQTGNARDYSKESFVIERLTENVTLNGDGLGQHERTVRVRVQSDAAVKDFGVFSIGYRSAFERVDLIDIRVTKPDGTVIVTPEADILDVPTEITRAAPTYSDAHEKQAPVRGLGIGDVLEWHTRTVRTAPDAPGQFWFDYNF